MTGTDNTEKLDDTDADAATPKSAAGLRRPGHCPTCGEYWINTHCRCDEDWFFEAGFGEDN